jgi:hypothetical protein
VPKQAFLPDNIFCPALGLAVGVSMKNDGQLRYLSMRKGELTEVNADVIESMSLVSQR